MALFQIEAHKIKIMKMKWGEYSEKNCEKDEILELYVNTSYFGDGYYCVKEAANGYFDKEPIDMNEYESSMLAGIPNAPSVYAPTKNPDLASQRQRQVLERMVEYEYITEDKKNEIMNMKEEEDTIINNN